ncbi:hypothetical protein ACJ41O_008746 [Fusarium nematophilum]
MAILLCFGVAAGLICVTAATPRLTDSGTYTATQRTIYTTIVTLIASIITTVNLAALRFALLDSVDDHLRQFTHSSSQVKERLQSRWQTVLAISSIRNSFRNPGISSLMILGALVTTCITAGFTATTSTRTVPYSPLIATSDPYVFARPSDNLTASGSTCVLNWLMDNGSHFCSSVWYGDSPQHRAFKLMDGININHPDVYAYSDLGVAIRSSAIGAPLTLYDPQRSGYGLQDLVRLYQWNVVSASACAPVMVRNPVKCRKGGILSYANNDKVMQLTADDGTCVAQKELTKPPRDAVWMLKKVCPRGDVGQATFVIGAANSNYAQWVAAGLGERIASHFPGQTYSAQCEIDVRNGVFEYRMVTLTLSSQSGSNSSSSEQLSFNRVLSAGQPCKPPPNTAVSDALFSTIAMAPYFITYEDGAAGWAQSLINVISRYGDYGHAVNDSIRFPPFAFPDSTNALEDVLGLVGALAGSRAVLNMSLVHTSGSAEVTFLRIGPGQLFALVYALVPLILGLALIWLTMIYNERYDPEWKSSRLMDLVSLGQLSPSSARGSNGT